MSPKQSGKSGVININKLVCLFGVVNEEIKDDGYNYIKVAHEKMDVYVLKKMREVKYDNDCDDHRDIRKLIKLSTKIFNKKLPKYLRDKKIKKFLPYREITYEIHDDAFEICYYHSKKIHDEVFCHMDKGYIMQPYGKMANDLADRYSSYELSEFSPEIHASENK